MFRILLVLSLILLSGAILMNVYRLIIGPSSADRIQALDTIGINLIAGIGILSVLMETYAYIDLILLIGILSFVGTVALTRFIERGVVIERKR